MLRKSSRMYSTKSKDMADDIEELLREVEEKYLPKQSLALAAAMSLNTRLQSNSIQSRHQTTSAQPCTYQENGKKVNDESSNKNHDIVPIVITKTTTRTHSSETA